MNLQTKNSFFIVNILWDVLKEKGINTGFYLPNKVILCKTIPSHSCPSPPNPGLQEQMEDPAVFEQLAFSLQLWEFRAHSSMSEIKSTNFTYDRYYHYEANVQSKSNLDVIIGVSYE